MLSLRYMRSWSMFASCHCNSFNFFFNLLVLYVDCLLDFPEASSELSLSAISICKSDLYKRSTCTKTTIWIKAKLSYIKSYILIISSNNTSLHIISKFRQQEWPMESEWIYSVVRKRPNLERINQSRLVFSSTGSMLQISDRKRESSSMRHQNV